jgi:hypothetical protein
MHVCERFKYTICTVHNIDLDLRGFMSEILSQNV